MMLILLWQIEMLSQMMLQYGQLNLILFHLKERSQEVLINTIEQKL